MSALHIWFEGTLVGTLAHAGTSLRFTYARSWLEHADAFSIGHDLPLGAAPFESSAQRYFGNLLPEGAVRSAVCRRLGLSEDNDFGLLEALGRECAGALVIAPEGQGAEHQNASYQRLDHEHLRRYLRSPMGYAAVVGEDVRLSLAGAQDKIPVTIDGDALSLPKGGAPSTHILKLPSRDFAALPENELFILNLARAIELPVATASAYTVDDVVLALIERYDRQRANGTITRLHQEDLCQALGADRRRKYEQEGGPTFAQCYQFVREHSTNAIHDTRSLLRWLAFNLIVGNQDNHAKNLSLLRHRDGSWTLAPFYDLVSTTAYALLSKRLAMSIGNKTDGGNLSPVAWGDEAGRLDIGKKYLLRLIADVCEAVEANLSPVRDTLAEHLGSDAPLQDPHAAIRKGLRATRRSLR